MPRYRIEIEVRAVRINDPVHPPAARPGEGSPIERLVPHMERLFSGGQMGPISIERQQGVSTVKTIVVGAESFTGVAKILGEFDSLAERMECENPGTP